MIAKMGQLTTGQLVIGVEDEKTGDLKNVMQVIVTGDKSNPQSISAKVVSLLFPIMGGVVPRIDKNHILFLINAPNDALEMYTNTTRTIVPPSAKDLAILKNIKMEKK